MPSPASSTDPVSMMATFWSKPSISRRMIWLISSARICILVLVLLSLSVEETAAELVEARAQAPVEHQAAHARHHPTDQGGIDLGLHQHLLAGAALERTLDLGLGHHVERAGRRDDGAHPSELLVGELLVRPRDEREDRDAAALEQQDGEVAHHRALGDALD